ERFFDRIQTKSQYKIGELKISLLLIYVFLEETVFSGLKYTFNLNPHLFLNGIQLFVHRPSKSIYLSLEPASFMNLILLRCWLRRMRRSSLILQDLTVGWRTCFVSTVDRSSHWFLRFIVTAG